MQYQIMFYGGLAGAIITLSISIYVYIKLNISQVIEHLTGFSLRKTSKKWRRSNNQDGAKSEKRTTNEIKIRKKVVDQDQAWAEALAATELMNQAGEQTALLQEQIIEETSILGVYPEETSILTAVDETSLLTGILEEELKTSFKKEIEIMVVHSETII
jgi:hypothetical protein